MQSMASLNDLHNISLVCIIRWCDQYAAMLLSWWQPPHLQGLLPSLQHHKRSRTASETKCGHNPWFTACHALLVSPTTTHYSSAAGASRIYGIVRNHQVPKNSHRWLCTLHGDAGAVATHSNPNTKSRTDATYQSHSICRSATE